MLAERGASITHLDPWNSFVLFAEMRKIRKIDSNDDHTENGYTDLKHRFVVVGMSLNKDEMGPTPKFFGKDLAESPGLISAGCHRERQGQ